MVEEWLRGDFSVDPYITHNMTHDNINTAFDLLNRGEAIRSVIHFRAQETMTKDLPGKIVGLDDA
jgi:S-(hydroxymethyl)glutathione dehydrogenase / alcohol dehydrogenase